MAAHKQLHKIDDVNHHQPGAVPSTNGEVALVGTVSDGSGGATITTRVSEVYNSDPTASSQEKLVMRSVGGHVKVPSGASGKEAINHDDAVALNARGPWQGVVVKTVTSDEERQDHSQIYNVGDRVIQLEMPSMAGRIHEVVGENGGPGDEVTWKYYDDTGLYGYVPEDTTILLDLDAQCQMMYVDTEDRWYNLGSTGEIGAHRIDDPTKHYSPNNRFGILYLQAKASDNSEGAPAILRVTDDDGNLTVKKGAILIASGEVAPQWTTIHLWPDVLTADIESTTEFTPWENNTLGVVNYNGSTFLAFKNGVGAVVFVEMTR